MATPWKTSDDVIDAIKRKIAIPISQVTFSEEDLLAFANEEMMISQVPSVLEYHEEYFVKAHRLPIETNKTRYSIPDRAIGMKLRDVMWEDESGNLFEMTRVNPDDKGFFQRAVGANQQIHKFYLEDNDVVLLPSSVTNPIGNLVLYYFQRPNQLVKNERAAIISNFVTTITINNASIVAGNTVTINNIVFTAVAGAPSTNEFQIGGTSIITATNLTSAINTNGVVTASNGSPSTNIVTLEYDDLDMEFETSNTAGFVIPTTTQSIEFQSIPSNITNGSEIDFLQTLPGHKTKAINIDIPANSISGSTITFTASDVPDDLIVGDYICLANECIIPQIPPDLHISLIEKTCARILASLGASQELRDQNEKINEVMMAQGKLIDNRVEGAPQKVLNRFSLLRLGFMGSRRRF